MSQTQVIQYLEKQQLIKSISNVYYLTDKLQAIAEDLGSPKEALKAFCEAIEIPFQIIGPSGGKYTIKYVSLSAGKKYLKVLKKIDKDVLIEVTKKYYKETQYPVTIKRYFDEDVWEVALESKDTVSGASHHKFED